MALSRALVRSIIGVHLIASTVTRSFMSRAIRIMDISPLVVAARGIPSIAFPLAHSTPPFSLLRYQTCCSQELISLITSYYNSFDLSTVQ